MVYKGVLLLLWVFFIHLAGLYLFARGFLLSRLSLSETNECTTQPCTLPPTHTKAVVLIIDALRYDFLTPHPPHPPSPHHHNILTLPRELTAAHPDHSFLFNAYADPPTSTLQRIKGLTTGSLPTFVDIGSNFGGSSIAEDSLLKQLQTFGKRIAFMGDDTWMSVFPDTFQSNMSFPYDSFNVEDLHTVDEGVIRHLMPLLEDEAQPFDFIIGHFLGVDHVGHRLGPDHPNMKSKLEQMNQVLKRVVQLLHDDTLLVVLGDHGMDRTGDHGGDGDLETSSAMWIYSKGLALSTPGFTIPEDILPTTIFPGTKEPHRAIQQIDLVPTLSLLLGLPVPFNNLGSIIPELFSRAKGADHLNLALQVNAAQIKSYLNTYRASPSGGELDQDWLNLEAAWSYTQPVELADGASKVPLATLVEFNRVALETCRSLWAQFNPLLMGLGLTLLGAGVLATASVYANLSRASANWDDWFAATLPQIVRGFAAGSIIGFTMFAALGESLPGMDYLDCILFGAPLVSSIVFIIPELSRISAKTVTYLPIVLLHFFSFFSNSFIFWEERIVPFLLVSTLIPSVLVGFRAPTPRLRKRILGFSLLMAACIRLMAISTVCREEQQPYCHVTYFESSSSAATLLARLVAPQVIIPLIYIVNRFLAITKSNRGLAQTFLPFILQPALFLGMAYWMLEWLETSNILSDDEWTTSTLRLSRTIAANLAMGLIVLGGFTLWWLKPTCIEVEITTVDNLDDKPKKQVTVIGFANAFGSPYLLFWSIFYSIVYTTTQLSGQIVLALALVALLAYLEVIDSIRDVKSLEAVFASSNPSAALDMDPNANSDDEAALYHLQASSP